MIYQELLKIQKPFFSLEDVAYALGLQPASAAVLCSRYVKKGLLTRLKRGVYVRTEQLPEVRDYYREKRFAYLEEKLSFQGWTSREPTS